MTRRIDRIHELRRRDEPVMAAELGVDGDAAVTLNETLGLPTGLKINFNVTATEHGDVVDLGPLGALRRNMVQISRADRRAWGLDE